MIRFQSHCQSHFIRWLKARAKEAAFRGRKFCLLQCQSVSLRISNIFVNNNNNQVSISPTFYARLFRTKVSREAFLYLHYRFELFLAKEYWRKCARKMLVKLTTDLYFFSQVFRRFFCSKFFIVKRDKVVFKCNNKVIYFFSLFEWRQDIFLQGSKFWVHFAISEKNKSQSYKWKFFGDKFIFTFYQLFNSLLCKHHSVQVADVLISRLILKYWFRVRPSSHLTFLHNIATKREKCIVITWQFGAIANQPTKLLKTYLVLLIFEKLTLTNRNLRLKVIKLS